MAKYRIDADCSWTDNFGEIMCARTEKAFEAKDKEDAVTFAKDLVTWADIIRKTFYEGGVDELISTRRLVHIVEAFSIFKNKMKAIEMCTNRFDLDTKTSFLDLYTKIDGGEDVSSWSSSGDSGLEVEDESDDDEDGNINYQNCEKVVC